MKSPYDPESCIIEGIMVTLAEATPTAGVNIAPMGPIVDPTMARFIFRPFKTSTTYRNLKAIGQGVFHVTDDALLMARAALRNLAPDKADWPALEAARRVQGRVLSDACRWFELHVDSIDDAEERTTIHATAVHRGESRPFLGFNRARHAILEAAILATRVHLTGPRFVLDEITRLQTTVDKTGSDRDHLAMAEIRDFVAAIPAPRES